MLVDEMIAFASEKLEKHNIQQNIEIRYHNGIFQAFVMEEDLDGEMFYGDGASVIEALDNLVYSDEGIANIDEIMYERYKENQSELEYKNKVYRDKQLYHNA